MRLVAALVALFVFTGCKSEKLEPITCPLYWTVEKDGKTLYLLGTIHGGIAGSQLPKQVWDDHASAPTIAIEADVEDQSLMSALKRTGPSLREELGPEYFKKLEKLVGGPVASKLDELKTLAALSVIMQQSMPRQVAGLDVEVLSRAKRPKQKVEFFETMQFQLDVLGKHAGARELKIVLDDPKAMQTELNKLMAAYVAGDEALTLRLFDEQRATALKQGYTEAELDTQREEMFYKRNESWIAPIEAIHASGGGFVAVGAGHLIGPRSVNDLLAKKGYTITRRACVTAAPTK